MLRRDHPDPNAAVEAARRHAQPEPAVPGPVPAAEDRVEDLLRPREPAVRPPRFRDWRQTPEGQ
eukprot:14592834-Alexandrium_andersonii.AAC.1